MYDSIVVISNSVIEYLGVFDGGFWNPIENIFQGTWGECLGFEEAESEEVSCLTIWSVLVCLTLIV